MTTLMRIQDFRDKVLNWPGTPIDEEEPDEWIADIEVRGGIRGPVLDAGCGPGRTALHLGSLGYDVLGVDVSQSAIARARHKAALRGNRAEFLHGDLRTLPGHEARFDTVIDIGCFHSLHPEDRVGYAMALHRMTRPGSVIYLRAFSERSVRREKYPADKLLPALRAEEIRQAFTANRWALWDLDERQIPIRVSNGRVVKALCWFAEIYYM